MPASRPSRAWALATRQGSSRPSSTRSVDEMEALSLDEACTPTAAAPRERRWRRTLVPMAILGAIGYVFGGYAGATADTDQTPQHGNEPQRATGTGHVTAYSPPPPTPSPPPPSPMPIPKPPLSSSPLHAPPTLPPPNPCEEFANLVNLHGNGHENSWCNSDPLRRNSAEECEHYWLYLTKDEVKARCVFQKDEDTGELVCKAIPFREICPPPPPPARMAWSSLARQDERQERSGG